MNDLQKRIIDLACDCAQLRGYVSFSSLRNVHSLSKNI